MLEELSKLIDFIQQKYDILLIKWEQSDLYESINQKNNLVIDINKNDNMLNTILNYRAFINDNNLDLKRYIV